MSYKVKIEIFEGPFDLLVYLIESAKMNIYDIPIAAITEQYLQYMKQLDRIDVESGTQFLILASTLIEIKSKMLLPGSEEETEEEEQEDPRKDLMEKLMEYKQFKEIAARMSPMEDRGLERWYKPKEDITEYEPKQQDELIAIDSQQFIRIFRSFLDRKRRVDEIHRLYDTKRPGTRRSTIREKMNVISRFLRKSGQSSFKEIAGQCRDRYEIAVTFAAMLEMIRNRQITVHQKKRFGEILIQKTGKKEEAS